MCRRGNCRHTRTVVIGPGELMSRRVDVDNADVEMQLLRVLGVRLAWGYPPRRALERELTHARLDADDHPVLAIFIDSHAQDLRVERRERSGIRAVEHGLL